MTAMHFFRFASVVGIVSLMGFTSCTRDESALEPVAYPTDAEVFTDGFGPNVLYQAFSGSKVDALDISTSDTYRGSKALKMTVPDAGDPAGTYAGGAFTLSVARDLSGYDALTFWAKSSMPATINQVGFGNDNTGNSRFVAMMEDVPVSTIWRKYILPIPLAAKLTMEQGAFFVAEGPENGYGYEILFDDIQYETLGTIAHPKPVIENITFSGEVGDVFSIEGGAVIFDISGTEEMILAAPGYFSFTSSDESIATVDETGTISVIAAGRATISAMLGSVAAEGVVTVNSGAASDVPTKSAPTPTYPAADVISLFSNAYPNVTVDKWSADWDNAELSDVKIAGDDVKKYSKMVFAGIEFISQTVDASEMTVFHMDVWTPSPTAPSGILKLKLVDFGENGVYDGGGDDSEHELTFTSTSSPPLLTGSWISFDIPLSRFSGLRGKGHLAQFILSGNLSTVYLDNVYFRK